MHDYVMSAALVATCVIVVGQDALYMLVTQDTLHRNPISYFNDRAYSNPYMRDNGLRNNARQQAYIR